MVAVSTIPYTVSIDAPLDFDDVNQRAQVQHGVRIYDISWDNTNERVVVYYNTEQNEPCWVEIRRDDITSQNITLRDALTVFGCLREDTIPVLAFSHDHIWTIETYLDTAISVEFLMQMDIRPASDYIPSNLDDPSPTSLENESIEDDSDDPQG